MRRCVLVQLHSISVPCRPMVHAWALITASVLAVDDVCEETVFGDSFVEKEGNVERRGAVEFVDESVRIGVEARR